MIFVLTFILSIISSVYGGCYNYYDLNNIRYINYGGYQSYECKTSGKGWTYNGNTFTFTNNCCENTKGNYVKMTQDSQEKYIRFTSDTNMKYLYYETNLENAAVRSNFYLENYPDMMFIEIKRNLFVNDNTQSQETIYVYDKPAVILAAGPHSKYYIDYEYSNTRPYLYIYPQSTNLNTKEIYIETPSSGCMYAFNTDNSYNLHNPNNGQTHRINCINSNVGQFCRVITCLSGSSLPSDASTCKVQNQISTIKSMYDFNYPDCYYNSSILELTITDSDNEIIFPSNYAYEWKGFKFESLTHSIKFTSSSQKIKITSDITFPSQQVTFSGSVEFQRVTMSKLSSGHHILDKWSATGMTFNGYGSNDILFLSKQESVSSVSNVKIEKCGGDIYRVVYSSSSVGCSCSYNGKYDVIDCEESATKESNTRDLTIDSSYDYSVGTVYWNTITFKSDGKGIGGTVKANKCHFGKYIRIYGNVICSEIIADEDLTLELMNSETVIGNLEVSTITSNHNIVLIIHKGSDSSSSKLSIQTVTINKQMTIQGEIQSLNSVTLVDGSKLLTDSSLTIPTLQKTGDNKASIECGGTLTLNSLPEKSSTLEITTNEIKFGSEITSISLAKLSIQKQIEIENQIKSIILNSFEGPSNIHLLSVKQSTEPLQLKIDQVSANDIATRNTNFVLIVSLKPRKINYSESTTITTMCDKQVLIKGTPDDSQCQKLSYHLKYCLKKDDSEYYYDGQSTQPIFDFSCPSTISMNDHIRSELTLQTSTYKFSENEQYDNIFIKNDVSLETNNKPLNVKLSAKLTLTGENNILYLSLSDMNHHSISTTKNNVIIFDKTSCGAVVDSTNNKPTGEITSSGLCSSIQFKDTSFECLTCRYEENNGKCTQPTQSNVTNCVQSNKENKCVYCEDEYYLTEQFNCSKCPENCLKCEFNELSTDKVECTLCKNNTLLTNGRCSPVSKDKCEGSRFDICVKCPFGLYHDETRTTCSSKCIDNCLSCSDNSVCSVCNISKNSYLNNENKCSSTDETSVNQTMHDKIVHCKSGYYLKSKTECSSCSEKNCETCEYTEEGNIICTSCQTGYLLNTTNHCVKKEDVKCKTIEDSRCIECENINHSFNGNECSECLDHCKTCSFNGECLECEDNYYFSITLNVEKQRIIKCIENSTIQHCSVSEKSMCITCEDGYFLEENICENNLDECYRCSPCPQGCSKCRSLTECYECHERFVLDGKRCNQTDDLHCKQAFIGKPSECAICNDGYYRNETTCIKCMENCEKCFMNDTCTKCSNEYYITKKNDCDLKSKLLNCTEYDDRGCISCSGDTYLYDHECIPCKSKDIHCKQCHNVTGMCTLCQSDYFISDKHNNTCQLYTIIDHCLGSNGIRCANCSFWHEPSANGMQCDTAPVWWLIGIIIGVVIFLLILFIILVGIVIFYVVKLVHRKREEQIMKNNVSHFNMKKSNIMWTRLSDKSDLLVDKHTIDFSSTENEETKEIPVDIESRNLICIGNGGKSSLQISFLTIDEVDCKYTIRCVPEQIILKNNEACEVEIFVTPLCSCQIDEYVQIVCFNVNTNKKVIEEIPIVATTEISTRLDPDEIVEEKIIGEGSFGIVFIGQYQGNKVAIKKLKMVDDENAMEEFDKEVSMLDKFRSEYIVHFYGAVFIPTKICMVTEFAPFGSLEDFMKKRDIPDEMIRLKFVVDAAKGIQYLHSNGILHRDLKCDNILVFCDDGKDEITCKLTDFGSSRNINQLMTNMTFTKGVGTPIYMAPEVLNQEKYTMSADIYSFSIILYEVFTWSDAYPKTKFRFPWHIAEFVMEGNRLEKTEDMPDWYFSIVSNCWLHNPKERFKIDKVIKLLEFGFC